MNAVDGVLEAFFVLFFNKMLRHTCTVLWSFDPSTPPCGEFPVQVEITRQCDFCWIWLVEIWVWSWSAWFDWWILRRVLSGVIFYCWQLWSDWCVLVDYEYYCSLNEEMWHADNFYLSRRCPNHNVHPWGIVFLVRYLESRWILLQLRTPRCFFFFSPIVLIKLWELSAWTLSKGRAFQRPTSARLPIQYASFALRLGRRPHTILTACCFFSQIYQPWHSKRGLFPCGYSGVSVS